MNNETTLTGDDLLKQSAKTLFNLIKDGTWDESDVFGFVKSTIKEQSEPAEFHKNQLERLIFHTEDLLNLQQIFFSTKKGLGTCKVKEELVRKMINTLKLRYNIERFKIKNSHEKLF